MAPSRNRSGKAGRRSLVGMLMRSLRVPVGLLAMFVGGGGVLLGLVVLTHRMVVGRLVVVMSGRTVVSGGIMMVLGGGMLGLFSHDRSPGWHLGWAGVFCWKATVSTSSLYACLQGLCHHLQVRQRGRTAHATDEMADVTRIAVKMRTEGHPSEAPHRAAQFLLARRLARECPGQPVRAARPRFRRGHLNLWVRSRRTGSEGRFAACSSNVSLPLATARNLGRA